MRLPIIAAAIIQGRKFVFFPPVGGVSAMLPSGGVVVSGSKADNGPVVVLVNFQYPYLF